MAADEVINIKVDRNYLALRSQQLGIIISENQRKPNYTKNPEIMIDNLKCQGAIEIIQEILEKFDTDENRIK